MKTTTQSPAKIQPFVRVRPLTRRKLDAIANRKRWSFAEAVDALADEFMAREGIKLPESKSPGPSAA